jgi:hypothetical protein
MKKLFFPVVSLALLLPQSSSADALYGTVRKGQAPAAGVKISVACPRFGRPGQPAPSIVADALTDARGSFSLRVPTTGRCEMRAERDNQVGGVFEVFVSNNPLRFDFEIDDSMNRIR